MTKILVSVLIFLQSLLGLGYENSEVWAFDALPCYEGGRVCSGVYNDGAGLASEQNGPTAEDSRLQVIAGTNASEYAAFIDAARESGFEAVYENCFETVTATALRKGDLLYYAYYCDATGEARVVEDNGSNSLENFGYSYSEGSAATLYQFDYPYADFGEKRDEDVYSTNGMMYIVKLADNSLVVIDGGSIRQSADKNIEECIRYMHKITGTQMGEPIRIALWYGTHGHSDHVTFFYKLLGYYHSDILLERVMFNYPSLSLVEHDERIDMFRDRLALLYPDVKYLKPHTGMSFDMANLHIDVLYTHEDAVSPLTGKTRITNTNDASTVCRLTAAGKRFLVTGDMNVLAQSKVVPMYPHDVFRCDVLQGAHHLYNSVNLIYDYADADWVLCPMSQGRAKAGLLGHTAARLYYKEEQLLYADNALYIFTFAPEGITLSTDRTACVCYDDSGMNDIK